MDNTQENQTHTAQTRHYARVMAFAVLGIGCICVGVFFYFMRGDVAYESNEPVETLVSTTTQFARSAPVHLSIPKLDLEAEFEPPLGLNEDQTIEVPESYTKVGWYMHGATPGEVGPAVVLGHVDSYEGPAIFWPLGELEAGDEVAITREDGTTAVFVITGSERFSQDAFPTELVYGPTDTPTLRLVTCSGTYNKGTQRYTHNLVVFGELKKETDALQISE